MIKMLVTDLDQTLFNDKSEVPKKNKEAVRKALDQGCLVVPATGRGPLELKTVLDDLGIRGKGFYTICCNGALIFDNEDFSLLESHPMDFEKAQAIYKYARENDLNFFAYTQKKRYVLNPVGKDKVYAKIHPESVRTLEGEDLVLDDPEEMVIKCLLRNEDLNFLLSMEEDIARLCNRDVEIAYSSDIFMEINEKGINKGKAIEDLCKDLGIGLDEVLAIGDSFNDEAMLRTVGLPVAVANAHLLLKDIAKYTTEADNNQGAVAEAIEKFVLNPSDSLLG